MVAPGEPPPSATPKPIPQPAPPKENGAAATTAVSGDDTAPMPVPPDLTQAHPGGLTAEQVGVRAAATSWNAKASQENLRAAAARVDEAWAGFLPRLSGVAKYTRLSVITPPNLGRIVIGLPQNTPASAIPGNAEDLGTVTNPTNGQQRELFSIPLQFPVVVDNWLLQGTLTVPISDYFLRIDQNYTSATHSRDAAEWDLAGARALAASNGRVAFYTWLRARGGVTVAVQALNDQRAHLRDARNQFDVGNASKADVLRAETAVSSAGLALVQAENFASLSEKQLRVALHVADEIPLVPGEDLDAPLPAQAPNLQGLIAEAVRQRAEVKSADANAASARDQAAAAGSTRYPNLSAFADGIVANPNPRIFPQSQTWFASWDVGAQITWSPNDVLTANGAVNDAEARAAVIDANKQTTRDGIEVEVTQDWQSVREQDFAILSSTRELASAQEAYRVQRELFNNGRGTSATLTDAETDLQRARLDLLNAKTNARIARAQLDHALGRDLTPAH
jgi:outer membrane protein TolC